jgi:hypothetical protein
MNEWKREQVIDKESESIERKRSGNDSGRLPSKTWRRTAEDLPNVLTEKVYSRVFIRVDNSPEETAIPHGQFANWLRVRVHFV